MGSELGVLIAGKSWAELKETASIAGIYRMYGVRESDSGRLFSHRMIRDSLR